MVQMEHISFPMPKLTVSYASTAFSRFVLLELLVYQLISKCSWIHFKLDTLGFFVYSYSFCFIIYTFDVYRSWQQITKTLFLATTDPPQVTVKLWLPQPPSSPFEPVM